MNTWLYIIACILRVICIFGPSYIHPDEFFQSYEIAARDVLDKATYIPWEYSDTDNPLRTPLSPLISVGLPLSILRFFSMQPPSWAVLFIPRFFLFLLSFIIDYAAYTLAKKLYISKYKYSSTALALVSTSWVMCVMFVRAFSNTLEALYLALALLIVAEIMNMNESGVYKYKHEWMLGAVSALGFFNRFTFSFFVLPIPFFVLFRDGNRKSIKRMISSVVFMGSGFLMAAALNALLDAVYFGHLKFSCDLDISGVFAAITSLESCVVEVTKPLITALTPLNFLIYNSNPENLATHGLHPRWLHAAVNMPLMFGPLALCVYIYVCKDCTSSFRRDTKMNMNTGSLWWMVLSVVMSSMILLSVNPHQEPRFIAPLLLPLSLLAAPYFAVSGQRKQGKEKRKRKGSVSKLFIAWLVFNSLAMVWFGVLHQGGVIRSLEYVGREHGEQCTVSVYYHTYMPPRFMLHSNSKVIDAGGGAVDGLLESVEAAMLECDNVNIVMPGTLSGVVRSHFPGLDLKLKRRFWPHVTTEDLPRPQPGMGMGFMELLEQLSLEVYNVNNIK